MKKLMLTFSLFILLSVASTPASAFVVTCTNCSNMFLQALERVTNVSQLESMWKTYAEEMMQTQQQIMMVKQNIEQYANMVKNTASLPFAITNSMKGDFKSLLSLSKGLTSTMGELDALDGIYDAYYPDFSYAKELAGESSDKINPKYYEYYSKWAERVDEATKATFKLSGQQLQELSHPEEFNSVVDGIINDPDGRKKALDAANQLTGIQLTEMRKLRALMALHIQNQAQVDEKSEQDDHRQKLHEETFFKNIYKEQLESKSPKPVSNNF